MKFIFGICCLLLGWCVSGFAQSQTVTYDFKKTPLSDVLREFHSQTEVDFAYDNFALAKILITAKGEQVSLDKALTAILARSGYRQQWINSTCIIAKQQEEIPDPKVSYHDILETIVVSGTVYDNETRETLPFAGIINNSSKQAFTANANGDFNISFSMSHPEDSIVFTSVGYESKTILLHHLLRQKPNAKIGLESKRLYLPAVLITAGSNEVFKTDEDNTNLVFNPNELVSSNGLGESDVYRSAQILPGISSNQENSGGLFIRGSSS
ncbi:MAG: hypothetical protein RLZZ262_383, partial [Bacteroidota bacterium]